MAPAMDWRPPEEVPRTKSPRTAKGMVRESPMVTTVEDGGMREEVTWDRGNAVGERGEGRTERSGFEHLKGTKRRRRVSRRVDGPLSDRTR